MSNPRCQQAKELFSSALAVDRERRSQFLDEACAGDVELRREVESLLASFERADEFIETPALEDALKLFQADRVPLTAGRRIGKYEVIREIGRGGMGAVYLATRADDSYKKRVAIKLIKRGMDTEDILRRFRVERQILASLDHPNIARLLDGGTTEDGLPYFVMEYVEGSPMLDYCDQQRLSTVERLKLFRKLCAAVQHAHQNLIVHRDLKPSNLLVTSDGEPKLLDFGIAKFLNPEMSPQTIAPTMTAMRLMTRDYASPEQVRGQPITTASDVYSLGVLLYRLLTGHHPYQFKTPLPREVERIICETEPQRPSEAVARVEEMTAMDGATIRLTPAAVSRARDAEPEKLRRTLSGDLDNIVLMAMRKEPARRYSSVEQFSEDLRRYLEGLPVMARKDTFAYRASKFVARNRVRVVAAGIVLLAIFAALTVSVWQARVAARQRDQAQLEKGRAEEIKRFLVQTLNYSNPLLPSSGINGKETTLSEALDEAARRLESGEFSQQPEIKAELHEVIAHSYNGLGKYQQAEKHIQAYIALQTHLYGQNHPATLSAMSLWATTLFRRGQMAEAESLYRKILPMMRDEQKRGNLKAARLADALNNLAYLRRTVGDSKDAEAIFREALSLNDEMSPDEWSFFNGTTRSTLASTLADQGRFEDALRTAREAVTEYQQRGETNNPSYGFCLTVLGGFLTDKESYAEADASLRQAEAIFRKMLAPSSLWLGDNLRNQGLSLYQQGDYHVAFDKASEAQKIYLEGFGTHYDHYPTVLIIQGLSLSRMGKPQDGEPLLREAVKLRTERLPQGHYWIAVANSALGECLTLQKRYAQAAPLLLSSYESLTQSQSPQSPHLRATLERLVALYENWGKADTANDYRRKL
jgi:serine/threonine protein kinase/Flp pilus assembly protein TadD